MWRYTLLGRHSNRTPLSYHAYQIMIGQNGLGLAKQVSLSDNPDVLILGQTSELHNELDNILLAQKENSSIKIVVFSEEPLWDTIWSGGFFNKNDFRVIGDNKIDFYYFNHLTTPIYDFNEIPYFITTEDSYLTRYRMMLSRNKKNSPPELIGMWSNAIHKAAFFLEKRLEDNFSVEYPEYNLRGLCQYRTHIAERLRSEQILCAGKGWSNAVIRQKLPDWHLDKITRLDKKSKFVSAIENTHQENYITEKIFDAYAVNGIPLYYASKNHRIFDILPEGAFVNLFDKTVEDAIYTIQNYYITRNYAELYIDTLEHLSRKFSKTAIVDNERESICIKIDDEFSKIL